MDGIQGRRNSLHEGIENRKGKQTVRRVMWLTLYEKESSRRQLSFPLVSLPTCWLCFSVSASSQFSAWSLEIKCPQDLILKQIHKFLRDQALNKYADQKNLILSLFFFYSISSSWATLFILGFNLTYMRLSFQFSHSVVSNSLRPHGLQHVRLPHHHQLPELALIHVH